MTDLSKLPELIEKRLSQAQTAALRGVLARPGSHADELRVRGINTLEHLETLGLVRREYDTAGICYRTKIRWHPTAALLAASEGMEKK